MENYSGIKTLAQLSEAISDIEYRIKMKERDIADNYYGVKKYINPVTYIHKALVRLYSFRSAFDYVGGIYDRVRDFFHARRKKSSSGVSGSGDEVKADGTVEVKIQESGSGAK